MKAERSGWHLYRHLYRGLVIEDSLNGVLAAKAARMRCLAVPDLRQRNDPRFVIADEVFGSLEELDEEVWSRFVSWHVSFQNSTPLTSARDPC